MLWVHEYAHLCFGACKGLASPARALSGLWDAWGIPVPRHVPTPGGHGWRQQASGMGSQAGAIDYAREIMVQREPLVKV